MHEASHVFWELLLILGSVFVFRSIWMLLDNYMGGASLWALLGLGFILTVPALYILNNHREKEYMPKKRY